LAAGPAKYLGIGLRCLLQPLGAKIHSRLSDSRHGRSATTESPLPVVLHFNDLDSGYRVKQFLWRFRPWFITPDQMAGIMDRNRSFYWREGTELIQMIG
jgi:hypothetical protein